MLSMPLLSKRLSEADKDAEYRRKRNKRIYQERKLAKTMRPEIEAWRADQKEV